MVSVASALAEWPSRVKKIFLQSTYDKEGIFALKLFIKGRPEIITVDDRLPFTGSQPFFAKKSKDGAWWMPILEKAYAKINTNYEMIGFGWMSEAARILTGAPSYRFSSRSYTPAALFKIVKDADRNKYVMTAASMASY